MGSIDIDLNRLRYQDYRRFLDAATPGDEIALLATVVRAWDFPGDPSDPASYGQLGLLDLLAVQRAVQQALRAALAEHPAGN